MEHVVRAFEIVGVAVLAIGSVIAMVGAARALTRGERRAAYEKARHDAGRSILLGLEVLIIADIVQTITIDPTLESAATLALIVFVRTFLSFWRSNSTALSRGARAANPALQSLEDLPPAGCPLTGTRVEILSNAARMAFDSLERVNLPVPGRRHVGLTTFDAQDPDSKFPPIEPLRPPVMQPVVGDGVEVFLEGAGDDSPVRLGSGVARDRAPVATKGRGQLRPRVLCRSLWKRQHHRSRILTFSASNSVWVIRPGSRRSASIATS
jgi:uncharacterized membrane protein